MWWRQAEAAAHIKIVCHQTAVQQLVYQEYTFQSIARVCVGIRGLGKQLGLLSVVGLWLWVGWRFTSNGLENSFHSHWWADAGAALHAVVVVGACYALVAAPTHTHTFNKLEQLLMCFWMSISTCVCVYVCELITHLFQHTNLFKEKEAAVIINCGQRSFEPRAPPTDVGFNTLHFGACLHRNTGVAPRF